MDKKEHRKALRQAIRENIGRNIANIDAPYARDVDTYLAFCVKLNELQENYIKDKGIDIDNHTNETYDELLSDILKANPEMLQEATDWALDAVKKKDEIFLNVSGSVMSKLIKKSYIPFLHGVGTHKLAQSSTRTKKPIMNEGTATITKGNHTIHIKNFNESRSGLRISTQKLLDACISVLTEQNHYRETGKINTLIKIPLKEYAEMVGIKVTESNIKDLRKRVSNDLETLYDISLDWTEGKGKNTKSYLKMRLIGSQGIKNGVIHVGFYEPLAEYLINAYVMQYPLALFKVDERNPSTYHIGRKLIYHHSMDNNQLKGTAGIISVKALLDECPDIPTYDEIMSTDRHLDKRIKKPFENALNNLEFITWEYSNAKNVPLTKEQAESTAYADFISFYIRYTVKDFPNSIKRIEAKAQEKEATKAKAIKRKAIAAKKKAEKEQAKQSE